MINSAPYNFDDREIEYDPIDDEYHLSFDPDQMQVPAVIIVQLVSYITETPPLSLPQLASSIEADSLNSWLSATGDTRTDFETRFEYAGCRITLDSTGEVWAQLVDTAVTPHEAEED